MEWVVKSVFSNSTTALPTQVWYHRCFTQDFIFIFIFLTRPGSWTSLCFYIFRNESQRHLEKHLWHTPQITLIRKTFWTRRTVTSVLRTDCLSLHRPQVEQGTRVIFFPLQMTSYPADRLAVRPLMLMLVPKSQDHLFSATSHSSAFIRHLTQLLQYTKIGSIKEWTNQPNNHNLLPF